MLALRATDSKLTQMVWHSQFPLTPTTVDDIKTGARRQRCLGTIQHPAAPQMLSRLAAVVEGVGVRTARFFQGVSEDGEVLESPLFQDGAGQLLDCPPVPGQD